MKKIKTYHLEVIYFSAAKGAFCGQGKMFLKVLLPELCAHCKNLPVPAETFLLITFYSCIVQMLHTKWVRLLFTNKQKKHKKEVLQFFNLDESLRYCLSSSKSTTISLLDTKHTSRICNLLLTVHMKESMNQPSLQCSQDNWAHNHLFIFSLDLSTVGQFCLPHKQSPWKYLFMGTESIMGFFFLPDFMGSCDASLNALYISNATSHV